MATLAAFFRRMDAEAISLESASQQDRVEALNAFRVRPIPNEDVYFFSKKIDNSQVVRQADPGAARKCWGALGISWLGVLVVMACLLPHLLGMIAGYQIYLLERDHTTLVNEKATLELEEATLLSPQRMEELAREMLLVDPAPEQVHFINPQADSALALNVPTK